VITVAPPTCFHKGLSGSEQANMVHAQAQNSYRDPNWFAGFIQPPCAAVAAILFL
jgi:hypothetical protein